MIKVIAITFILLVILLGFIAIQLGAIQHGIDLGNKQKKENEEKKNQDDTGKKKTEKPV